MWTVKGFDWWKNEKIFSINIADKTEKSSHKSWLQMKLLSNAPMTRHGYINNSDKAKLICSQKRIPFSSRFNSILFFSIALISFIWFEFDFGSVSNGERGEPWTHLRRALVPSRLSTDSPAGTDKETSGRVKSRSAKNFMIFSFL